MIHAKLFQHVDEIRPMAKHNRSDKPYTRPSRRQILRSTLSSGVIIGAFSQSSSAQEEDEEEGSEFVESFTCSAEEFIEGEKATIDFQITAVDDTQDEVEGGNAEFRILIELLIPERISADADSDPLDPGEEAPLGWEYDGDAEWDSGSWYGLLKPGETKNPSLTVQIPESAKDEYSLIAYASLNGSYNYDECNKTLAVRGGEKIRVFPQQINYGPVVRGETPDTKILTYYSRSSDESVTISDVTTPESLSLTDNCWVSWWCPSRPPIEIAPGDVGSLRLEFDSEGFGDIEELNESIDITVDEETRTLPVTGTVFGQPEYFRELAKSAENLATTISLEANRQEAINRAVEGLDSALGVAEGRVSQDVRSTIEEGIETVKSYGETSEKLSGRLDFIEWYSIEGSSPSPQQLTNDLESIAENLRECADNIESEDPELAVEAYQNATEQTKELAETVNDGDFLGLPFEFVDSFKQSIRQFAAILLGDDSKYATADSPVNLRVNDPDGKSIDTETAEIEGGEYLEVDTDADTDQEDVIAIPNGKPGQYTIEVEPENDAASDDTYSLAWVDQTQSIVLADDRKVSDIPEEPYQPQTRARVNAEINIDPDTINKRSEGRFITGYIQLPEGVGVESVDDNKSTFTSTVDGELSEDTAELVSVLESLCRRNTAGVSIEIAVENGRTTTDVTGYTGFAQDALIESIVETVQQSGRSISISLAKTMNWDAFQSTVNISSVKMNEDVDAVDDTQNGFVTDPELQDRDGNGLPETAVKFPRETVVDGLETGGDVRVTVTGSSAERRFIGSDTLRVKNPGNGNAGNGRGR